ncbi:MAG: PEP-utilizing enzyme, partial [Thermoplasmata archaeon]
LSAFTDYSIDENHQMLFRLHSRVGITKLYRRFIQLRNFCYLDQLLVEVAKRLGASEAEVRCLLPEEVEALLQNRSRPTEEQRRRIVLAVHAIDGEAEEVFSGGDYAWVKRGLELRNRSAQTLSNEFKGTVVSPGIAKGRAKVINRREDAERVHFQKGDILVSESTDPDLFDLLLQAGGVATEAGGVTSHAAIVARTYGKPAIVGIPNLLSAVRNDDFVILDADSGTLSIVRMDQRRWTIPDEKVIEAGLDIVGPKAFNLSRLARSAVQVPRFFVVPLDAVSRDVSLSTPDAAGEQWRALSAEVGHALEYLRGSMFIIRSSVLAEDSAADAHAGEFQSFGDLERQDVVATVTRHVERLLSSPGPERHGSVIIQEMILGDVSGVCSLAIS